MKREKISLFVLVVEIAVIALLHSAKGNQPEGDKQLVKKESNSTMYQLKTNVPVTSIK